MVLIIVKATPLRAFADIFALVVGTSVVAAFHLDGVETVAGIADIPTGLASIPTPHLPDFSLAPALEKTGLMDLVGADNIVWLNDVIGAAMTEAYGRATAQLTRPG